MTVTATQRVKTRKVDMAVVAWVGGWSFDRIAAECGYASPQMAQTAVEKAVASSATDVEKMTARIKANTRLDFLLQQLMPMIKAEGSGDRLAAMNLFRGITNDIVRINGAAAPLEVTYTPSQREFDEVIAVVSATRMGVADVEEADVVSESIAIESGVGLSDPPGVPNRGLHSDEPAAEGGGSEVAEAEWLPDDE